MFCFTICPDISGKRPGVKSDFLRSAIFVSFEVDPQYRDTSLPGYLKNGHGKVPSDIIEAVRNCDPETVVKSFKTTAIKANVDSVNQQYNQ